MSTKVPCYFTIREPGYYPFLVTNIISRGKKRRSLFQIAVTSAQPCFEGLISDCSNFCRALLWRYIITSVRPQQWQMQTPWARSELEQSHNRSPFSFQTQIRSCDAMLHSIMSESISGTLSTHSRWGHIIVLAFPTCCCQCDTGGGRAWLKSYSHEAKCEAQACPVAHRQDLGASLCAGSLCRYKRTQRWCGCSAWVFIAQYMGHVHMRFWLLSNSITRQSQKDTPSVYFINVKSPIKICILCPKEHWSTICFYNAK